VLLYSTVFSLKRCSNEDLKTLIYVHLKGKLARYLISRNSSSIIQVFSSNILVLVRNFFVLQEELDLAMLCIAILRHHLIKSVAFIYFIWSDPPISTLRDAACRWHLTVLHNMLTKVRARRKSPIKIPRRHLSRKAKPFFGS
jgi:hypothetical protein